MGAAGSITEADLRSGGSISVPQDRLDRNALVSLVGGAFDETKYEALKDADGCVTREQVLEAISFVAAEQALLSVSLTPSGAKSDAVRAPDAAATSAATSAATTSASPASASPASASVTFDTAAAAGTAGTEPPPPAAATRAPTLAATKRPPSQRRLQVHAGAGAGGAAEGEAEGEAGGAAGEQGLSAERMEALAALVIEEVR